ncbi:hypothetical protein [Paenarthrobacter aurescens]|jgi:hypothetical protein|uniref:Uncharacterized protein n=1 Tax=Paenarthrobacter aurescens (strain TC1) TaxID=290340 RepID=A1RDT8_PAEAT|nr:hypothetical protein [Paenarthrobacter aurescens]ABM10612.1 hypothetical protein AAur_pTC20254 [Paenarthrobacter aurescens TC1]
MAIKHSAQGDDPECSGQQGHSDDAGRHSADSQASRHRIIDEGLDFVLNHDADLLIRLAEA